MRGNEGAANVVVLAASRGGVKALCRILSELPPEFPAAVLIVQHRAPDRELVFEHILSRHSRLPVDRAWQGEVLRPSQVYVAAPHRHLTIGPDCRFAYHDGARIRGTHSSANPLFESVAKVFGPHAIAVVLTGSGYDATNGVQAIKAAGGAVLVQSQATSVDFGMPGSALRTGSVDLVVPLEDVAPTLISLVGTPGAGVG